MSLFSNIMKGLHTEELLQLIDEQGTCVSKIRYTLELTTVEDYYMSVNSTPRWRRPVPKM